MKKVLKTLKPVFFMSSLLKMNEIDKKKLRSLMLSAAFLNTKGARTFCQLISLPFCYPGTLSACHLPYCHFVNTAFCLLVILP
jgi:hypothetical protein